MNLILLLVLERLADKVLDKLLEKLISDRNLKHLYNVLKLQIVMLYLDWQLTRSQMADPGEGKIGRKPEPSLPTD
ncbi:hypothetical protein NDA01_02735 [Trichocoleus desertorum AS-A10]|uniref:hypothetical protein n=1 Tax=Trichocoleus desertorum TaxID=1481672 RepID=UPI003298BAF5